jgi:GNAT superfamily N-acetyltransferase
MERARITPDLLIRPARASDLPAIYDLFYEIEVGDDPDVPPRPAMLPDYPHLLAHGELTVAERGGAIIGFAGVARRGETAFLSDLFVHPDRQSGKVGARLLRHAFAPHIGRLRFTVSSTDVRALALYVRSGMRPLWPNFLLRAPSAALADALTGGLSVVEAMPNDPQLIAWDAEVGGRERPQDHAYWVREEGGVPFWLLRGSNRVGMAYARLRAGTLYTPDAARVGPVAAQSPEDAAACALVAARWAAEHAPVVRIDCPGPHPALPALIEAGFRITYVETFCATSAPPFDPRRYLGSGGSLF